MQKRAILIGAVSLVKGNVRDDGEAMVSICDELEPIFQSKELLKGVPFDTISLIIRYGEKHTEPQIGKINRKYSELEVAIELPMSEIRSLSYEELRQSFKKATIQVLNAISDKFSIDYNFDGI